MLGDIVQTIPSGMFSSANLKNLTVNNSAGVVLAGPVSLSGILKLQSGNLTSNGNLTLASTSSGTALVDGAGTGNIIGNVKMQRYLPSGFSYKYLSSPVQSAKVSELANDIDLNASFPTLYRYNEDIASTGFMSYTNTTSPLLQLTGYAANFGVSSAAKTADINGVVNNGLIGPIALYNHNQPFTKGFSLVGNPYPSPIDWNIASGWSKTNIDNAVYYFNAGSTNQYTGTYSSYINGVSSDGVANNIIPSMQGFFVHVANGSYPVSGSLGINNNARVSSQSATFHRTTSEDALIRIALSYDSVSKPSDKFVAYFNEDATLKFDGQMDALKLMNTDDAVPNLYALSSDFEKLSVYATTPDNEGDNIIPLSVKTEHEGDVVFNATDINEMPAGLHPFLYDASLGISVNLIDKPEHHQYLTTGTHDNRFYLIFSKSEKLNYNPNNAFNVYSAGDKLFVTLDLFTGQQGDVVVRNMLGQVIAHHQLLGFGNHELPTGFATGVYIVSFTGSNYSNSKKVMINH